MHPPHQLFSIIVIITVFLLSSCTTYTTHRGNLSEAMEKSSDNNHRSRQVADTHEVEDDDDDDDNHMHSHLHRSATHGAGSGTPLHQPDNTINMPYVGSKIFSSATYSANLGNVSGISFVAATPIENMRRHAIHIGFGGIPTKSASDLYGNIPNCLQLHLGYQYRIYTTPDYTLFGLYMPIDVTVKTLFWEYQNAIISDVYDEYGHYVGTDKIKFDGLFGVSAGTGGGVTVLKTNHIQMSGEVTAGGSLYWFNTFQGFKNDVFVGDLYVKASVEVLFKLGQ